MCEYSLFFYGYFDMQEKGNRRIIQKDTDKWKLNSLRKTIKTK